MNISRYRPDVDGLRAIAVLGVVLFHAGLTWIGGGYVGVDVFFVISGYLITGNIFKSLQSNSFSFLNFYGKRLRRIQPALYATLFVSFLIGSIFYVPVDLKSFGQSLAAATLFSSNIYFFFKSGYFDPLAITKPLLHTWSLGVEEQFYIFFPLFMVVSFKYLKEKLLAVCVFFCVASFIFSIWQVAHQPVAAFYLPFSRAWEFAIGSIVALTADDIFKTGIQKKIVSILALLLLLVPMFVFTEQTSFPGVNALFPCLGAGLLIYLHRNTRGISFKLLASRPVVFVGKISYSVYLVHWPLVVFLQYVLLRKLDNVEVLLYLFVVIVLGWLSWKYVEEPFRHKGFGIFSNKVFYPVLAVVSTTFVMVGVASHVYSGFPSRLSPQARIYADAALDTNPIREQCDSPSVARIARDDVCIVGSPASLPNFVFIGDSFGDALVPGIDAATNELGKPTSGYILTHSGCFPLPGIRQLSNPACDGVMEANIAFIRKHPEIKRIVIAARWTSAALGNRFGQFKQDGWIIQDEKNSGQSVKDNKAVMSRSLEKLIAQLSDRNIIFIAYIPEQEYDVPRKMYLSYEFKQPVYDGISLKMHEARQQAVRDIFTNLSGRYKNIHILDIGKIICHDSCPVILNGNVLYADDNHLSSHGAIILSHVWAKALSDNINTF